MRRALFIACPALSLVVATACSPEHKAIASQTRSETVRVTSRVLLNRAHEELLRSEVKEYAATLAKAVAAPGSPEDKADAQAETANYLWRIVGDVIAARKLLAEGGEVFPAPLLERARLELSLGNLAASRAVALAALKVSRRHADRLGATVAFARAVVTEAADSAMRGRARDHELDDLLRQALAMLRPYVADEPGVREPSRYALLAALWCDDGETAGRAWESYFRLAHWTPTPAVLGSAAQVFRQLPPSLAGSSTEARLRIVHALSASRLFPEAAALSNAWKLSDAATAREALEYARWISELKREFDEDYRQIASGKKAISGRERLDQRAPALLRALHGNGVKYSFDAFLREVRDRFGAVIRSTSPGANFGHIVDDSLRTIEQYGHKAQLRVIVLDSMVSNGYTTWLWDGRAAIGGWSSDGEHGQPMTIVSIRGDAPLSAWAALNDPDITQRNRENLEQWNKEDDERARQDPYGYLPGLLLRMYLAGARRVYDREAAQGLKGPELRSAFLADYERLQNAAVITAHEGRHALDKQSNELALGARLLFGANEELEYRAKLSEIAFAPEPLLAIGAIFNSDIGTKGSAHGMANLRVMRGLVGWMKQHADEIKGLDRSRPLLPQFDLLTDDQMRAAFRSMDPWAK